MFDTSFIIRFPKSLEAYHQVWTSGEGDGEKALCALLFLGGMSQKHDLILIDSADKDNAPPGENEQARCC